MIRPFLRPLLCAIALLIVTQSAAIAQCSLYCESLVKSGYDVTSGHSVYLDPTLSAAGLTASQSAIDAWNQVYVSWGLPAPFTYTSSPFWASLVIEDDPTLHGQAIGGKTDGSVVDINPDYDGAANFLKQVLLHEIGHVIGFTDVSTAGCNMQTVMYFMIDPNAGSYLTSLTSTDRCDIWGEFDRLGRELFRPPGGYGGAEGNGSDSPIVINLGVGDYSLTGAESPVAFDIRADGQPVRIGWTSAGADEAFLCLDRNGNGTIDNGAELFGTATPLNNGELAHDGFSALEQFDDNHDGVIDHRDRIWSRLLLWRDLNHDGISQPWELTPVASSTVTAISLDYHWTGRRDSSGNTFRYKSTVWISGNGHLPTPGPVYDIFFISVP